MLDRAIPAADVRVGDEQLQPQLLHLFLQPAQQLLFDVGLTGSDGSHQTQAARGRETPNRSGQTQTLARQEFTQAQPQLLQGVVNHARRDFFATDFQQKIRHAVTIYLPREPHSPNVSPVTAV